MEWMAWTPVTAAFFGGIALLLVGMTVWEIRSPCIERRGFLPIATTRGDRLFIGLLGSALQSFHSISSGRLQCRQIRQAVQPQII